MGHQYPNPPVAEVIFELHLPQGSSWAQDFPQALYKALADRFPYYETEVPSESTYGHPRHRPGRPEVAVLLDMDRRFFVQLAQAHAVIHCLAPYPGWPTVRGMVTAVLDGVVEVRGADQWDKLGLRYVNRIRIPESAPKLEDYFEFRPHIGPTLPQALARFMIAAMFMHNEGRDALKIEFSSVPTSEAKATHFLLDLQYFQTQPAPAPRATAHAWLESAHDEIERVFEGCITGKLRAVFQRLEKTVSD